FIDFGRFYGIGRAARAADAARRAIGTLRAQNMVGILPGGLDRRPHEPLEVSTCGAIIERTGLRPATTLAGWQAIDDARRGTGPAPAGRPVAADVVIGLSTRNRRRYGGGLGGRLVGGPPFGGGEHLRL